MAKANIVLTSQLFVPLTEQAYLIPMLENHIAATKVEPGCLFFVVTQDTSDPTLFHISESFRDQAAYDHHEQRGANTPWGKSSRHLQQKFTKNFE